MDSQLFRSLSSLTDYATKHFALQSPDFCFHGRLFRHLEPKLPHKVERGTMAWHPFPENEPLPIPAEFTSPSLPRPELQVPAPRLPGLLFPVAHCLVELSAAYRRSKAGRSRSDLSSRSRRRPAARARPASFSKSHLGVDC